MTQGAVRQTLTNLPRKDRRRWIANVDAQNVRRIRVPLGAVVGDPEDNAVFFDHELTHLVRRTKFAGCSAKELRSAVVSREGPLRQKQ